MRVDEPEAKKPGSSLLSPPRTLPVLGQALQAPPTYAAGSATLSAPGPVSSTQLDEDHEVIPGPARVGSQSLSTHQVSSPPGLVDHVPQGSSTVQPPWVQALLDGMQNLHIKQDALKGSLTSMQAVVGEHSQQIASLTAAHKDSATLHEHTLSRLSLEADVKKLRSQSRSVSPAPVAGERSVGPREGRSPPPFAGTRLGGGHNALKISGFGRRVA